MSEAKIFLCSSCEREHVVATVSVPKEWEWRGSRLFCDDCIRLTAFSFTNEGAAMAPPAAIRLDGEPDEAMQALIRAGVFVDLGDPTGDRCATIAFDPAAGWKIVAILDRPAGQRKAAA